MKRFEKNKHIYLTNINSLLKNDLVFNKYSLKKYNYWKFLKKKPISKKNIVTTCAITGARKRTYKKNGLNRHVFRNQYLKQTFNYWNINSW